MNALQESYIRSLRAKCVEVLTPEEAEISVRSLEAALKAHGKKLVSLSCPEINIAKQVAIIRTPNLKLDLINPRIVHAEKRVLSYQETCASFPDTTYNCWRYQKIVLETGFKNRTRVEYTGQVAFLIQHEVDHLNGKLVPDRRIRTALARENGEIKDRDYCPCASRKRFYECCLLNVE